MIKPTERCSLGFCDNGKENPLDFDTARLIAVADRVGVGENQSEQLIRNRSAHNITGFRLIVCSTTGHIVLYVVM